MEQPSSSMKIKSYFASSVEQAIQEARQELGTDAMLITSRRSSPETRSLGAYEVVFGLNARSNAPTRSSASLRPGRGFIRRAAKPARSVAGNQEHAARRAALGVFVVGSRRIIRGIGC
jgi:flagellar biosynthesis GTPase FlhF